MDYTSTALVKQALHATATPDDTLIARLVTAASRAIDRVCANSTQSESENYFRLEAKKDEVLRGRVDVSGHLLCWPHKPEVDSVSTLEYRFSPLSSWNELSTDLIEIDGYSLIVFGSLQRVDRVAVKVSYTGGLGADLTGLPADLVEAATVLAARYYKEAESGLTDSIGVAELTTMVYTKATPVRVKEMLSRYVRTVPW